MEIADRFEQELRTALVSIKEHLRQFPFYLNQRRYRRSGLPTFPHLILFLENAKSIRIIVLKHVKRAPSYGLRRE